MKHLRLLPALLLFGLTTGCASVVHGVRQEIWVDTDPPGATASAEGQTITTPGKLRLDRRAKNLEVVVEKEGYVTRRVPLNRKGSGVAWGNLGFLPVGVAVGGALAAAATPEHTDWGTGMGNTMGGGLVGGLVVPAAATIIDHAIGGAYKLDPPTIVLRLEPLAASGAGSR